MPELSTGRVIIRLFAVVRPYVGLVVVCGLAVLIKEIARVSVFVFVGRALDVVVGASVERLDRLLVIEGVLVLCIGVNGFAAVLTMFRAAGYAVHDARRLTVDSILHLPMRFYETSRSGDMVSRVNGDSETMEGFVIFVCQSAVFRTLMLFMTMGFMVFLSWKIALVNFAVVPLGCLLSERVTRPLEKKHAASREALGRVTATASDVVQGAVEMKAFAMEASLGCAHDRAVAEMVHAQDRIARADVAVRFVNGVTYVVPLVVTYGIGAALVLAGEITPGAVLAMQYVLGTFGMCVDFVFEFFGNVRASAAAGRRLIELWDAPKDAEQRGPAMPPAADGEAAVRFRDVGFAYADEGPWVLRHLDLTVRRGETVALVGRSGCGKTTVLRLIAGFYAPAEGAVEVFGRQPCGPLLHEVRRDLALVAQEPFLFPVGIGANIALGAGDAEGAAAGIAESAAKAGIHEFVCSLPEGYDAMVGERGARLSGGQRQRVAIARAFHKDAPLLLLDEPTSSLDSATENLVQQSLARLMRGRTTIVVAHRLSTIRNVDRIHVMDGGTVVEAGTHAELMAAGGRYQDLYRRQAGETSGVAG